MASVLDTPNIAFYGSVVACEASLNTQQTGQFNGNLFLKSWTAQEQVNVIASPVCVPTLVPDFNAATRDSLAAHV